MKWFWFSLLIKIIKIWWKLIWNQNHNSKTDFKSQFQIIWFKVVPNHCKWLMLSSKNKKVVRSQKWPRDARYISGSNDRLRRYGHSKLFKMAACHQLGFDVTGNSAIRSADPENPTLEQNMKCIWSPVAEIWPLAYLGAYMEPPFWGEGEVIGGKRWHRSKERWWFPIGSPLWLLRYL